MNIDNLIVIKGGAYTDIKKALRQWVDLYSRDLQDGWTFQLFKNGHGNHIIQADDRLDNERFYYLVNYLNFPEGINYKIDIQGFTKGKDNNQLKDKDLLIYISQIDKEYDNVFVQTSDNENFKVDFGGNIMDGSEKKTYSYPSNLNLDISENITVNKKRELNTLTEKSNNKLERRFKIVSAVILSAFILSFFFFRKEDEFLTANYTIAFAVWGWLTFDYKILQIDKLYFGSLGLGLTIFSYGLFLNDYFDENITMVQSATTMPVFLLIVQRPLRLIFMRLMKREPKVEKPAPSFADFVYIFTLWIVTILIPVFYYSK
jgi:hypothetical protein